MNAQQLSRRHVMQLAAGALASAGLVRGSLAASGSNTRAKAIIIFFQGPAQPKGSPKLLPQQPVQISSSSRSRTLMRMIIRP